MNSKWRNVAIGLGSAIIVFLIIFCAVPLKTVPYTVTVQRQVSETYYEEETALVNRPLRHKVYAHRLEQHGTEYTAVVHLQNIDEVSGWFEVKFMLQPYDSSYVSIVLEDSAKLNPSEQWFARVENEYGDDLYDWRYEVIPETKTIAETNRVEKEQLVWKDFTETRYKKVSMLNYLLQ